MTSGATETNSLGPEGADNALECPFPGIASYNYGGRASFFGRNEEAAALVALILSRRLTILTAASGDGKTSLLHAAVAPLLLHEGIEVVIAEPGGKSPIDEFARYCLGRLSINPKEMLPILEALEQKLESKATLADARDYCSRISRQNRQAVLRIDVAKTQRPINQLGDSPLVSWLRDPQIPDRYIAACGANAAEESIASSALSPDKSLQDAIDYLKRTRPPAEGILAAAPEDLAVRVLQQIENAVRRRKRADDDFELVVILDQFEELFTQFEAGNGPVTTDVTAKRQHRAAAFMFVREFLKWRWPATVRLVLSLRKEHYADLRAELGAIDDFASSTYPLAPLTKAQAKICMNQKDHWPGGVLNDEQIQTVVDTISEDGEFVVPIVLSVVGAWLWHAPNRTSMTVKEIRNLLETDDEQSRGSPLDQFVARAFDEPDPEGWAWDALDKQEALDILEQLIIRNGDFARRTRVDMEALIKVPNRKEDLRQGILDGLVDRKLVRKERRGGYYAEIVHEKLIKSFDRERERLRASSDEQIDVARLPELLKDLDAGKPSDPFSQDLLRVHTPTDTFCNDSH